MHVFDWAHRIDLHREIQEIYLHRFVFQLALGTVAIFVPLYLYELGHGFAGIFLYFAVFYGTFIAAAWPAAHLAGRLGYKHTSFLSSPLLLGFYLLLRSLETPGLATYGVAALGGLGFITYWIGMNSEMARNSHDGDRGTETGVFFSMPQFASVISPFLGGLVIAAYDFNALFLLAAALVTVSYTPFLLSREHYSGMDGYDGTIFDRQHVIDFLVFAARGANDMGRKVLWPLYLAVVITGALNIGGAGSIMALGGALTSIAVGSRVTPENRTHMLRIGATVLAATWLIMAVVTTPLQAFIIAFLNGIVFYIAIVPLYTEVIEHAEHEDIIAYFAFREIGLCTGRILILLAFIAVFSLFSIPQQHGFLYGFGIVAIASIFLGVLSRRMDERLKT